MTPSSNSGETKPLDVTTVSQQLAKLREPFDPKHIEKRCQPVSKTGDKQRCPKCSGFHRLPAVQLSYVGHAQVTNRLLDADPAWTWRPMATEENGNPVFVRADNGFPIGLWILLTVCGITRPGYGSVEAGAFDPEKQLIGDAIRNAAMRFGVALELWSKAELETEDEEPDPSGARPAQWKPSPPKPVTPTSPGPSSHPSTGGPPRWIDEKLPGKKFAGKTWRYLVMGDETNGRKGPTIGGERWNWLEFVSNADPTTMPVDRALECLGFIESGRWGVLEFTPSSQRKAQASQTKAT